MTIYRPCQDAKAEVRIAEFVHLEGQTVRILEQGRSGINSNLPVEIGLYFDRSDPALPLPLSWSVFTNTTPPFATATSLLGDRPDFRNAIAETPDEEASGYQFGAESPGSDQALVSPSLVSLSGEDKVGYY